MRERDLNETIKNYYFIRDISETDKSHIEMNKNSFQGTRFLISYDLSFID